MVSSWMLGEKPSWQRELQLRRMWTPPSEEAGVSGLQRQRSWVVMGHSGGAGLQEGEEAVEGLEERGDLAAIARSLPSQDLGWGPRAGPVGGLLGSPR